MKKAPPSKIRTEWTDRRIRAARVACTLVLAAGVRAGDGGRDFPVIRPLITPSSRTYSSPGSLTRTIGPKEFYVATQGPYLFLTEDGVSRMKQVGLYDRVIPGHINASYIKYLLPEEREKMPDGPMKRMFERILEKGWPIHTLFYHRLQGLPAPTDELIEIIDRQWMGDGQPETVYRLEPVFHYLKTGERWVGSSMHLWKPEVAKRFFAEDLLPRLEAALPFVRDLEHKWTRPELRVLSDLYCEEFYRPARRPVAWGMYVGNYHLAGLPGVRCVAEKGADAFTHARARGTIRQSGGDKFYFVWRGHEPTEMYGYFKRAWYTIRGDEWGLPLPHLRYYIFRPYLIGTNGYTNEGFVSSCIQDVEGDGQLELSTIGHLLKDMLDLADRQPERGVPYASVALLLDYNRAIPAIRTSYAGYNLPNDDADFMNAGILRLLFPKHRHAVERGGYMRTAPLGEIFEILQPNAPGRETPLNVLENYRVLFGLGGLTIDAGFAERLREYVSRGGVLVLNAADAGKTLSAEFLGLALGKERIAGQNVACTLDGQHFAEEDYELYPVRLAGAKSILEDQAGRPVVTRHAFGNGYVVLLLPRYCLAKEPQDAKDEIGRPVRIKALLRFLPHFFEQLTAGTAPIEFRRRPEDAPDLSWHLARKGDGWVVTVFNYSCARESIVSKTYGTAKVHALYPLKEVPFEIVCRTPVGDILERYADRDVNWTTEGDTAVIRETIHGGEVRVYELQPGPISLPPRVRPVNYARNRPVTASSSRKGFPPSLAVDGIVERNNYWWSDTDPRRHYTFEMPQWLQVDLEQVRTIDHVFTAFYYWEQESPQTRLRVYKYLVEASLDGKTWQTVIDESRNEDNADRYGLERWFSPVQARFVRLTVLRNSSFGGARVIELKAMGPEQESVRPVRVSILPKWEVQYPPEVRDLPAEGWVYLSDMKPVRARTDYLPAGRDWADMNGSVTLMTSLQRDGKTYEKSLYGQANSEIVYTLGGKYATLAAAIGLGNNRRDSSVRFRVLVDGEERYASPVYRLGMRVLPVVVDVSGGAELRLLVEDAGDGIANDYAWWGDARLAKRAVRR